MKCIRHKCFETNSSSTHSLVVTKDFYGSEGKYNGKWGLKLKKSDNPIYDFETLKSCIKNTQTRLNPHRILYLEGGDYGREYMRCLVNSFEKANYLVTYIKTKIERMSERKYFENILTDIFKKGIPEIDEVIYTLPNEDNDMNPDYEGFYDYEDDLNLDHDGVELARTILTSDGVKLKDFGVFSLYDFIFNTSYILLSGEDCRGWDDKETGTVKIDDNTFFTNAFGLRDDCTLKENPNYFKEHNREYNSEFVDNIKLELSCYEPQEKIDKLEEK